MVGRPGYSSHAFREHIRDLGAYPAIRTKQNRAPVACPEWIYIHRNQVERLWARLKGQVAERTDRVVSTQYENTARSFMDLLCLAATCDWIERKQGLGTRE